MTTGRLKQMKKLWTYLLTMVWLISAMPAAFAAGSGQDAQAEAIAQKVKSILAIGDEYTEFSSEHFEDPAEYNWHFNWSNPITDQGISVFTTDEGQILSYNQEIRYKSTGFAPVMPKISKQQAKQLAQDFLSKVLPAGQIVQLTDENISYSTSEIKVNFDVLLNGLPSPLYGTIEIVDDGIFYFSYHGLSDYIGDVPSAKPTIQAAKAQAALHDAENLRLLYMTNAPFQEDADKKAVLQYEPTHAMNDWIVDAHTGKLIDPSNGKSFSDADNNDYFSSIPVDMVMLSSFDTDEETLNDTELNKHKDLLSIQQLDSKLRSMPELGLTGAKLTNHEYTYTESKDNYACCLVYAFEEDTYSFEKYIIVDAKTAQLKIVFSPAVYDIRKLDRETSAAKAQQFMKKYFPDVAENLAPAPSGSNRYTYQDFTVLERQEQSIPFPENYYAMIFSGKDGSILFFTSKWDKDIQFETPENIVDLDTAIKTWQNTKSVLLEYTSITEDWDEKRLALAYRYKTDTIYFIDAATGKVIQPYPDDDTDDDSAGVYTDITAADQEIMTLTELGIGYPSTRFEKAKPLTQIDMLTFLISAIYPSSFYQFEDEAETYQTAYYFGMLPDKQRNPTTPVTRLDAVKTILNMAGYGKVAQFGNIYICTFADAADIPAADRGYAALAQAIGMVQGSPDGKFLPNAIATREQFALMFYRFMNR